MVEGYKIIWNNLTDYVQLKYNILKFIITEKWTN